MVSQVVLSPESFVANVAGVGSLVRVRSLVNQQVVGLGEAALAVLADELLLGPGGQPTGPKVTRSILAILDTKPQSQFGAEKAREEGVRQVQRFAR